jgi:hypothetical protein
MAENPTDLSQHQSDHDLLVILNERVGTLTLAVEKKNDDREGRIRLLESDMDGLQLSSRTWKYVMFIAMGLLALIVAVIAAYISRS